MKQDEGRPGLNLAVLSVILLSASLIVSGCCACGMLKSAIEEPGPGMTVRDNYRGMGLFLYTGSTNLYQKTFLSSEAINYYIYSWRAPTVLCCRSSARTAAQPGTRRTI